MPEKQSHPAGNQVAASGLNTNGNGLQPHSSTESAELYPTNSMGQMVAELQALADAAKVEAPPAPAAGGPSGDLNKFLYTASLSDEGNAQCINRLYPGHFLYNDAFGWLHWTGSHWDQEGAEAALDRATVVTLLSRIEAASQPDTFEEGGKLRKFCLPNKGRVQGAEHLLQSLVVAQPSQFDTEPDLLNCANGVVDLRTGQLIAHDPGQRFTYCSPVDYKPAASSDQWISFLDAAVGAEQAEYLQLAVGYTLTGHTREEVLFYLYGPSRAGKGLFTETLQAVLGSPLAKEVNFGTFTAQRTGDSQNFDLAPLKACRLVAASESNSYERFNEAKLKALTGGNEVYAAFKHRDLFNYRPQFKIWLSSNQPANADPDDDAVWGRLRLIEFPHSHLGSEDKMLKTRMKAPAVLEGVLAWAVRGAMQWYALGSKGLSEPAASASLKGEQRESLDAVGAWVEERCMLGEIYFSAFTDLYQNYEKWCKDSGVEPKRSKGLSTALQRKGFKTGRRSDNGKQVRGFSGLQLDR